MATRKHTTTDLIPFQFHTTSVSAITDTQGDPWFVALDVCAALGVSNVSKAVSRLDADEKNTITLSDSNRGNPETLVISESGLYDLALSSRKPIGKEFKRWVKKEVLPSIRKTGRYVVEEDPVERYPQLRAIRELVTATAEAQLMAERAEEKAHAAEVRAQRAEDKADIAIEDLHRMTIQEFVLKNGLHRQFPPSSYGRISAWLGNYSQRYGLRVRKAPVVGKPWDDENSFELQAFGAFLDYEQKRPRQITLVKEAETPPA
jgi:prophage antirepressor-like protein